MAKVQTRHSISLARPVFDRARAWLSTPSIPSKKDQPFWKPTPMSAYVEGLVRLDAARMRSDRLGARVPKKRSKGRRRYVSFSDACHKLAKTVAERENRSVAAYVEMLITRHLDDVMAPRAADAADLLVQMSSVR